MGYPRFEKIGVLASPLDLDRGIAVPFSDMIISPLQEVQITRGGSVHTTEWSNTDKRYMKVSVHDVAKLVRDDLIEFFEDLLIRWGLLTFTFYPTGTSGTSYTARLALEKMSEFDFKIIRGSGLADIDIILEVT